jgi:hypothetical protein
MLHQEKVQSVAVFTRQAKKKRKHPNILKKKKKKTIITCDCLITNGNFRGGRDFFRC